ncbi:MAG: hypothetical protein CME62_17815 [Halobacteriovoraceae bacterium]|nr:hypothetical protein [Halobacteriovoraceae bacterium]|tara:strand:- start:8806 stop:9534 length:729 start_codon:yes stop_codon:yes gene_type:complete
MKYSPLGDETPLLANDICQIALVLDSKNTFFKLRYEIKNENLVSHMDFICSQLQDKTIDQALDILIELSSQKKSYDFDFCCLQFRQGIEALLGHIPLDNENDPLICRCTGISLAEFESYIVKFKGDEQEIKKHSNINMICSDCTYEFKNYLYSLSQKHHYFAGFDQEEMIDKINKLLEEFQLYSPAEFSHVQLECTQVAYPKVVIKVDHKGELEQEFAKKTLRNYLERELKLAIEIYLLGYN